MFILGWLPFLDWTSRSHLHWQYGYTFQPNFTFNLLNCLDISPPGHQFHLIRWFIEMSNSLSNSLKSCVMLAGAVNCLPTYKSHVVRKVVEKGDKNFDLKIIYFWLLQWLWWMWINAVVHYAKAVNDKGNKRMWPWLLQRHTHSIAMMIQSDKSWNIIKLLHLGYLCQQ